MKARQIWWVFLLLLVSCISTVNKPHPSLLHADSLICAGRSDSALSLLESVESSLFTTELSRAWYALLLTQAKDKNYVTHTDDSLIRIAVDYFDTTDDMLQRAKAHYYWGRVFQDKEEVENTVREFLTASALLEKTNNYELSILLKNNLGLLFWEHGLSKEADSLYRQSVELAEAHHDTLRLAIALVKRADICMEKGKEYYADADTIMNRALKLVDGIDDEHVKSIVFSSLSYLRDYQERLQDVIFYAHQGLGYTSDSSAEKGYYLVLGSAYSRLTNYDSATIYLKRSLDTDSYYTRASAYMRLSEVAAALGDKDNALKYETLYGVYKDSMKMVEQPTVVVSSLKNVLHGQSVSRYESSLVQYRYYLLLIGGLLLVSVCFYLYKRKRRHAEIVKLQAKHQNLYISIESLQKELFEKKIEIDNLQKHYQQLKTDTGQKEQQEGCLQELLGEYHRMQENLEKQLNEKNEEVIKLRRLNLKSVLASSPVYIKLLELCKHNRLNPDEKRMFSSEEWNMLLQEIDIASLGFVERLQNKYESLLEDDIHFCCLVKLEFKYSDIAFIWGCLDVAVYKRSNSVLKRMGVSATKKSELINILNRI